MAFCARELTSRLQLDLRSFIDVRCPSWSIDDSPQEAACYRLNESLVKKFNQADRPSPAACSKALEKFLRINERCRDWTFRVNYEWEAELMNEFRNEVHDFFYQRRFRREGIDPLFSDYSQLFMLGRTGPGASLKATGTDFYSKLFDSPLTATAGVPDIWEMCLKRYPVMLEALCHPTGSPSYHIVDCNKLSFVNKTVDIARSICTEPSINMWMQLGMGSLIESRLKDRYGIDLGIQPDINRELARQGSISDRFSTIDLESASDSMSLSMLRWCIPSSQMDALLRMRSPASRLPDGSLVSLNMISTMGNGYTFPLQTALFSAAVVAVYRYLGLKYVLPNGERTWSVFGDDIIVVKEATRHVTRLLGLLGFVVNSDKTFVEGPFRESCGTDWFNGVNVRPFFLRRLKTMQDAFVAINGLNLWSAKTGVLLPRTVQYILECFPRVKNYPVPPDEDDVAGLHLPRQMLSKRQATPLKRGFGIIPYLAFKPYAYTHKVDVERECIVGHRRRVTYNPKGLWIAFLYGNVRGGRIGFRQKSVRYFLKRRITPSWGFLPPQILPGLQDRYTRFLNACEGNLMLPSG